jgi:xylulokinase
VALVLGLDVSTTATKALLIDGAGTVRGAGTAEYPYLTPRPRWSEQDPDLWWQGTKGAVRGALAAAGVDGDSVAAVGLTGQMHGAVLLDAADRAVRPAILWNDQRTDAECEAIREALGIDRLVAITGNDAMTGFTAPKLLWVRDNEPEVWARVAHVLLPKDYVRLQLTGVHAVDKADGAGTLLFDLGARDWSPEVLDALDLDPALFPPTFEGPEVTGVVTASAAESTGLRAGTPVVAGAGDQAANAVGVGAIAPGIVALSLGTSGVIFAATDHPIVEPRGRVHAFCHALPDRWHLMSVMLSAAGSLRWFRDALAPGIGYRELVADAATAPAGSGGLFFLPYLTGERSPHPDPHARGAFIGLTVGHDRRHLTRAVLEGVSYGLRDGLEAMRQAGMPAPSVVRASGGGLDSPLWRQILADVLNTTIAGVGTTEGAAFGAALLATPAGALAGSVSEAVERSVRVEPLAEPGPDAAAYAERHERYRELYQALSGIFPRLEAAGPGLRRGGPPARPG